jgi:molybdopterin/thiamine biosynthesis adenylyltransferase
MDTTRNIGILYPHEQEKITNAKIAILGAGMGSVIAELCVRSGFRNIFIADGDVVSSTNLNRQVFTTGNIGSKKTITLKERLEAISDDLSLSINNEFLKVGEIPEQLNLCDLIIDSIDLSSFEVIDYIHGWAREYDKPIIFPINLGWKSMVTVFNADSPTVRDMLGISGGNEEQFRKGNFVAWAMFLEKHVPDYGKKQFQEFLSKASSMDDWCPAPQIGVTTFTTASLVVTTAIQILVGNKTPIYPSIAAIDLFQAVAS